MQINRLFQIVYLLMVKDGITASELAERFGVSTRTIYRDIDVLSASGIPVYSIRGKGGGVHLMSEYILNKSLLTEKEQNEILFALQSAKATNAIEGEQTLSRLSGLFQKETCDWIDVDFTRWGIAKVEQKTFQTLKNAILEKRVISFSYYHTNGRKNRYFAEPFKLLFKGGWYLQAFCRVQKADRTFKICRMTEIELTGDTFETREAVLSDAEGKKNDAISVVPVKLLFQSELGYRVFDEYDPAMVKRTDDGNFLVTAHYSDDEWLYSHLLSFGEKVCVLSPESFRKKLREKALKVAALYLDV